MFDKEDGDSAVVEMVELWSDADNCAGISYTHCVCRPSALPPACVPHLCNRVVFRK